jgi:hypothetical protein
MRYYPAFGVEQAPVRKFGALSHRQRPWLAMQTL